MNKYASLLLFITTGLNTAVIAQESTGLTNEDRQQIFETTRNYNICVQQNALKQLDNNTDIREVAAHAVNLCEHQLSEFREKLGSKANSDLYSGLERQIKNRTIKKLLPLLMYEKSSRQIMDHEG